MSVDYKRLLFFGFAAVCGISSAIYGQPLIHDNERAITIIVTVFSILSGFLVAIITIIGDPGVFIGRSWRSNELNRGNVFNRLTRQKWMFILYLVTLGLILAASLIETILPNIATWIERVYLGMAVMAFILSLGLPSALMNIQLARHDEVIKNKRNAVGINK